MNPTIQGLIAWAVLVCATASLAGPALQDHPPPGLYEIDSRTTQTSRAGPMVLTTVTEIDGRTGDQTVTTTRAPDDMPPQVTRAKGSGPVRHCVGATGPTVAGHCKTVATGESALAATCPGISQRIGWRRLDAGQWEWREEVAMATPPSGGGWGVPAGLGLPPAEAARAQAMIRELSAAASVEVAAWREQARREAASGDPERAADARAALAALEGASGAGEAPSVVTLQRYRRVADRCVATKR